MGKRSSKAARKKPSKRSSSSGPVRPSFREVVVANSEILALILLIISGFLILDLIGQRGEAPSLLQRLFGWAAPVVAVALIAADLAILTHLSATRLGLGRGLPWNVLVDIASGATLLLLAALGLTHLWHNAADPLAAAQLGEGGGLVGWLAGTMPGTLLGDLITTLLLVVLAGLGLWLAARPFGLPSIDWRGVAGWAQDLPRLLLPDTPTPGSKDPLSSPTGKLPKVDSPEDLETAGLLPSIVDSPETGEGATTARPRRRRPPRQQPASAAAVVKSRRAAPRPDHLPPLELLSSSVQSAGSSASLKEADIAAKRQIIEHTLASFSVPVEVVDVNVGPAVTQFGVRPGYVSRRGPDGQPLRRRVRVSRIKALADDLALALAAPTLRIEAPVPGKGYVGIEVPNSRTSLVSLRAVMESAPSLQSGRRGSDGSLTIALGRDVAGMPATANLAALPHLLIAGATGSGKSVCINSILCSLLLNHGPDDLRLLLFDPKQVELTIYNGLPHLVAPVVTDLDQVVGALTWLILQMDERYRAFAQVGARNLETYNRKLSRRRLPVEWRDLEPFPYLVLVVDELADLMMAAGEVVEHHLCRLAQMARATGIHLVISTQRPSVDVVTGLIKANFPARIAFAVTSQTDSRVILDAAGAEKLLGQGDMLFLRPDSSKLARIQGCFVTDTEIEALVNFWKDVAPAEQPGPDVPRYPWTGLMAQLEDQDEQYEKALDLLRDQERVSTSWLQRRLRVGYNRASEIISRLEDDGYVGPDEGGGRGREVLLIEDDEEEEADWLS